MIPTFRYSKHEAKCILFFARVIFRSQPVRNLLLFYWWILSCTHRSSNKKEKRKSMQYFKHFKSIKRRLCYSKWIDSWHNIFIYSQCVARNSRINADMRIHCSVNKIDAFQSEHFVQNFVSKSRKKKNEQHHGNHLFQKMCLSYMSNRDQYFVKPNLPEFFQAALIYFFQFNK